MIPRNKRIGVSKELHAPIAKILTKPRQEWFRFAKNSGRTASVDVDWRKYNPNDFLFTQCSIVSSCDTEADGHTIKKSSEHLVNANGNAWTNPVLLGTFRTFIGGENYREHCFPAGTRVLMADGTYKEIQDIVTGDYVINRNGVPDKVLNLQKRNTDSLVKITATDILSRDLYSTGNHPFWVYSARKTCPKTGRENSFSVKKDFWKILNWKGFACGVHPASKENYESGIVSNWKNAIDLDENRDFLTHPSSSLEIEVSGINQNRAELIGWFLAEGCYMRTNKFSKGRSGIVFCLGNDESDVAERLKGLLLKEFGDILRKDCEPRIYPSKSGSLGLYLSNAKVADFFFYHCGEHSWKKKLSKEIIWLPKEMQATILKHYLNGDGTGKISSKGYRVESKSKDLIQQLLFISWRLGICPVYREVGVIPRYSEKTIVGGYEVFVDPKTNKKSRPGYGLWFNIFDSKNINVKSGHIDLAVSERESKEKTHTFSDGNGSFILSRIKDVSTESCQNCEVFNIEVETDNSYVAEGVVVHNCQIKSLSYGKILDAVVRPFRYKLGNDVSDVFICDILVATERKHTLLCRDIESGKLKTLSMGTVCSFVGCSQCGKYFSDEEEVCEHLRDNIGGYYIDSKGVKRIVAELCGKAVLNPKTGLWEVVPDSNKYIEASWVWIPAYGGAVVNHFVKPEDVGDKIDNMFLASLEDCVCTHVADKSFKIARKILAQEKENIRRDKMVNFITGI